MISAALGGVTLAYLLAGSLFAVAAFSRTQRFRRPAAGILWAGLAAETVAILARWGQSFLGALGQTPSPGILEKVRLVIIQAPLSNFYESLVFFSWCVPFLGLVVFRRHLQDFLGILVAWLACLILAYASLGVDSSIRPLMPALKSNWLLLHVVTCFLGYAAFGLGFGAGLLYLWQGRRPNPRLPGLPDLDHLIYQTVTVGFLFLTLGILTGAVWAETAWGRYWSWDPKETWSLITWFIYATLLHARLVKGWQGRRIAWLAVAGFLAVLFTYFGVSFLLPGLHSYLT